MTANYKKDTGRTIKRHVTIRRRYDPNRFYLNLLCKYEESYSEERRSEVMPLREEQSNVT
jgi:hypothetical protein